MGGLTTFVAMGYIIILNPAILEFAVKHSFSLGIELFMLLIGLYETGMRIEFLPILLTLFLIGFLDTLGTAYALGAAGDLLDEHGNLPEIEKLMLKYAYGPALMVAAC
jgi:xanthine/uracil/vitamin C permease (AzgA family)